MYTTIWSVLIIFIYRKDRYNLAKIEYLPYLLHSSNPGASTIMQFPTFVPQFHMEGTDIVGGEVDGVENLRAGEYRVLRDINIRPGGRLALQPGVTLKWVLISFYLCKLTWLDRTAGKRIENWEFFPWILAIYINLGWYIYNRHKEKLWENCYKGI